MLWTVSSMSTRTPHIKLTKVFQSIFPPKFTLIGAETTWRTRTGALNTKKTDSCVQGGFDLLNLIDHLLLLFVCSRSKLSELRDMMWKSRAFCTCLPSCTGVCWNTSSATHTHTQMFTEEGLLRQHAGRFVQICFVSSSHNDTCLLLVADTERTRSITRWIRNDYREDKATTGYWADWLYSVWTANQNEANHAWSIRDTVVKPELCLCWRPLLRQ